MISSSPSSKISSQQYTNLAVRQLYQTLRPKNSNPNSTPEFQIDFYTATELALKKYSENAQQMKSLYADPSKRQQVLQEIVQRLTSKDAQCQRFISMVKENLQNKAQELSSMESRQNLFLTDCLKESMSIPFKKQLQKGTLFNFNNFFRVFLNREMRRILWQKMLVTETNKQNYFKYDHEVTPYNVASEFLVTIQRLIRRQENPQEAPVTLKRSQRDMMVRVMEFVIKKYDRVPNNNQNHLALITVLVFSHYQPSRQIEIGSIFCGLEDLSFYYFEPHLPTRLSSIFKALELIDEEAYLIIKENFFGDESIEYQSRVELNEVFENFRQSLTTKYLSQDCSCFLIDQLLIKKRNQFDIYVLFAIVIMVLGDYLESLLQRLNPQNISTSRSKNLAQSTVQDGLRGDSPIKAGESLVKSQTVRNSAQNSPRAQMSSRVNEIFVEQEKLSLLSFKKIFGECRHLVRKQDLFDAYNVIYQKIPPTYDPTNVTLSEPNRLFEYLLQYETRDIQSQVPDSKDEYNDQNQELLRMANQTEMVDPKFVTQIQEGDNSKGKDSRFRLGGIQLSK